MNWIHGVIALMLTWLSFFLSAYVGPRFQEILGMQAFSSLEFLFFLMLVIVLDKGFRLLYNKVSGKEKLILENHHEQEAERSDFYLRKKQRSNTSMHYQLVNAQEKIVWLGVCRLEQKIIKSIEIFEYNSDAYPVMKAIQNPNELFSVYDKETFIGYIAREDMDVIFSNSEDKQILLAAKKEIKDEEAQAMDNILFLADLRPHFDRNGICYVLHGRKGRIWAKYYVGLQNLELVEGLSIDEFTMKIVMLIAMILDNRHN